MKKENALKKVLTISVIVLICLVSFVGIFVKKGYNVEKVLPDYIFGMDFSQRMLLSLQIKADEESTDNETDAENDETIENTEADNGIATDENAEEDNGTATDENVEENTTENKTAEQEPELSVADIAKKAKKVFEERLSMLGVPEYYIRINESTGNIVIELPKDMSSSALQNTIVKGEFKILDQDKNVIADNNSIKDVVVKYSNTSYSGTMININIMFNDNSVKKFKELQSTYVAPVNEEGTATESKVSMEIDGTSIYSTDTFEFYESVVGGDLQLYMGQGTETEEELQEYYTEATSMAAIIKSGSLEKSYEIEYNNLIDSDLSINIVAITGIILFATMAIYMIYKFKTQGLFGTISLIGFIASLLLVLRYTNVIIAFEGVFAIALIIAINYIWIYKYLCNSAKEDKKVFYKTVIEFLDVFMISSIIAIAFCFASWLSVFSFGMIMFWGIILILVYNLFITRNLISGSKK